MLKIVIALLVGLIIFFIFRARKGMTSIDRIYSKENTKNMEDIRAKIQKQLNDNKTIK